MSIFGIIGFVFVVAAVFLICFVAYWIGRAYNKGRGIDVSYAFLEVPPE